MSNHQFLFQGVHKMGLLAGKVALITGGGSGLGKAIAKLYIQEGAKVSIIDQSMDRLRDAQSEIGNDDLLLLQGDVSSIEDNDGFVAHTLEKFGKLDIFVGNAGVFDGNKSLRDIPKEQLVTAFDDVFRINVLGYLLGAKATYPELVKTNGCMIFSASYASLHSAGGGSLYTASKHAVAGIIKQLAFEFAPRVRVNGVAPGVVSTNMKMPDSLGKHINSVISGIEEALPLQFIPDPKDYAGLYIAAASDLFSKTMTGSIINADTGIGIRGLTKVADGFDS